jgi:tRNA A37 threonylcarbamoyladenosine synthetase subunit TsaC/SUA5/YrdC
MTGPRLVGARRLDEALAALAAGAAIAVPGDGGYLLAASHEFADAAARLRALGSVTTERDPFTVAVGRREQAVALASVWTKETAILTDRMWPGPLTVMVPALAGDGDPVVHITMPATRALRALCRESEPLTVRALRRPDGTPVIDPAEAEVRGSGPTVVDCTLSPPLVCHVGALPESYVDAALMMGNRRRRLFGRRSNPST